MNRTRNTMGGTAHRPLASIQHEPYRNTSYDAESGLVYNEVEVPSGIPHSNWINDYRTPKLVRVKQRAHKGTGARSLAHMALIRLGLESQNLTIEVLTSLPWSIGEQIWQQITEKLVVSPFDKRSCANIVLQSCRKLLYLAHFCHRLWR